jgi:prepilin-type processing-associated H-X9-DG protein
MNAFMGDNLSGQNAVFPAYLQMSELIGGPCQEYLVFVDTHEDWLEYCNFRLNRDINLQLWLDLPASRHNRSGTFSLHDGHVERRRWIDPRTPRAVTGVWDKSFVQADALDNADWDFMWQRMTKAPPDAGEPP